MCSALIHGSETHSYLTEHRYCAIVLQNTYTLIRQHLRTNNINLTLLNVIGLKAKLLNFDFNLMIVVRQCKYYCDESQRFKNETKRNTTFLM